MADPGRRYLDQREAELALGRGKSLEIFLGDCGSGGEQGVRFAEMHGRPDAVTLTVYEMQGPGRDFLDLYEAVPLGDVEDGIVLQGGFNSLAEAMTALAHAYPGPAPGIVNGGVLGDEYLDHLERAGND